MLNTLAVSFSDKTSAGLGKVFIWPVGLTFAPYAQILQDKQFFISFFNSVNRVFLGGVVNVVITILMAYPLSKSKKDFRAKNIFMWFVVFTMLFNGGLVPNYILVQRLGLIDSIWALVLPGAVPVFSVIILMNYFKGLPASLEEAALIDGANPFDVLLKIFVPLSMPSIAVVALFSVVGHWNAFFDGIIYITKEAKQPLQTYIQQLQFGIDYQLINSSNIEQMMEHLKLSSLTFNSAKVIVSMIPILLIYPLLQRFFVTGIIMGAVKE